MSTHDGICTAHHGWAQVFYLEDQGCSRLLQTLPTKINPSYYSETQCFSQKHYSDVEGRIRAASGADEFEYQLHGAYDKDTGSEPW